MQSANLLQQKLELIEKIIHVDDQSTLDFLKSILNDEPSEFKLSEEQQNIVRENTENYLSGKDKGKSWDEIKSKLISKRNE
ncbi:hypothetical protein [Flavobacterium daejeonense]|uniref:hypothetical protein n=1 Tax=Flavobacterium daejeonense TaxID=350893 RepID=UPI00047A55E9|nr:hypothetical protein [Flavobacterium daejeonense]